MTTGIQSGTTQNHFLSTSDILENGDATTGGVKNASASKTDPVQNAKLTDNVVQKEGTLPAAVRGGPELAKPSARLSPAQTARIEQALSNIHTMLPAMPAVLAKEAEAPVVAEIEKKHMEESLSDQFDITKMSSLPAADLLMMVSFLLRVLGIANTAFEGKLNIIASDAAHGSAASIEAKGLSEIGTRIAGAATVIVSAGAGVVMTLKGLEISRKDAATNGKAMEKVKTRMEANEATVAAGGKPKAADAANDIAVKPADGGAEQKKPLADSKEETDAAQKAIVAAKALQVDKAEFSALQDARVKNDADKQKWQAGASVTNALGTALNAAMMGVGQFKASEQEALQKIIDILQRSSGQTSDNNREQARAAVALIAEMLHAMIELLKSHVQTAGQVAGAIKG